eukprot:1391256-Prymnesium_polylepis.2
MCVRARCASCSCALPVERLRACPCTFRGAPTAFSDAHFGNVGERAQAVDGTLLEVEIRFVPTFARIL